MYIEITSGYNSTQSLLDMLMNHKVKINNDNDSPQRNSARDNMIIGSSSGLLTNSEVKGVDCIKNGERCNYFV